MSGQDVLLLESGECGLMLRRLGLGDADLLLLMERFEGAAMLAQLPLIMRFRTCLGVGLGVGVACRCRGVERAAFLEQA